MGTDRTITKTPACNPAASGRQHCVILEGGPQTDECAALAARAAALVGAGAHPAAILVTCACAAQKEPLRSALNRELGDAGAGIALMTVTELAAGVLNDPAARAANGRRPRILTHFEQNCLNEDLKTLGIHAKRLREMLKFLHKGLATLQDRDADWLIMAEEVQVLEAERRFAAEMGVVLPCELANLAVACFENDENPMQFDHVLACGWTALNPASQTLLRHVARQSLTAAGYQGDPGVAAVPYPDPDGLVKLASEHPDAAYEVLPDRAGAAAYVVAWDFPDDEADGVSTWAAGLLAQGQRPGDVAVIVPNRVWAQRLSRALESQGVPARTLASQRPLSGDTRKQDRSASQRAFALLGLAADPNDVAAWRLWTGAGDWLLNSMAWQGLRQWHAQSGATDGLAVKLRGLGGLADAGPEPFLGAHRLAASVRTAHEALGELARYSGAALIKAACSACEADASELLDLLGNRVPTDATALCEQLRASVVDPAFPEGEDRVLVGQPGAFCGRTARTAVLCGLVDGFMPGPECFDDKLPPDVKQRNLDSARAVFEQACAIAQETLVLSRFNQEWLFDAEPAHMEVARIRADARGRLATIRPSAFLTGCSETGPLPADRAQP